MLKEVTHMSQIHCTHVHDPDHMCTTHVQHVPETVAVLHKTLDAVGHSGKGSCCYTTGGGIAVDMAELSCL